MVLYAPALSCFTGAHALTTMKGARALTTKKGAHALTRGDGLVKPARDVGGPIKGVGVSKKIVLDLGDRDPDWTIPYLRRHMKKIACVAPYRYSPVQYPIRD